MNSAKGDATEEEKDPELILEDKTELKEKIAETFGGQFATENISISPTWRSCMEESFNAKPYNRVIIFREPADPILRLNLGYVRIRDRHTNLVLWEKYGGPGNGPVGPWLGYVPAGYIVEVDTCDVKFAEPREMIDCQIT